MKRKVSEWGSLSLVLLLTAIWLWPLTAGHYVSDDFIWLYEASRESLLGLFRPGYFPFVRPVSNVFWWVVWHLGGLEPWAGHVMLIGCHLIAAGLLFVWTKWLYRGQQENLAAWAALLFFLTRPMSIENVNWLSASGGTLAAMFIMATLVSFWRQLETQSWWWALASVVGLTAAIWSKESAMSLLLALVIAEWLYEVNGRRSWSQRTMLFVLLATGVLHYSLMWLSLHAHAPHFLNNTFVGLGDRWCKFLVSSMLGKGIPHLPLWTAWLLSGVIVAVLGGVAYGCRRRVPVLTGHLLWFALSLLPFALFVTNNVAEERYAYIPNLALAVSLGGLVTWAAGKARLVAIGVLVLLCSLGAFSAQQRIFAAESCFGGNGREAITLQRLQSKIAEASSTYVYVYPEAEAYSLYAYALYTGTRVEDVHSFAQLPNRARFVPVGGSSSAGSDGGGRDLALFYNVNNGSFFDVSQSMAENLSSMVAEGRAPVIEPIGLRTEPMVVSASLPPEGWALSNITANGDGTWHSEGLSGSMVSPPFCVSPLALRRIVVELEVKNAAPGAGVAINWATERHPQGQTHLPYLHPFSFFAGNRVTSVFALGNVKEWWTEGCITRIIVIPSSKPADFRFGRVLLYGCPRTVGVKTSLVGK